MPMLVYSTFDQKPTNHIKAAEIVLERAKRLVESKQDVVVLVDSITRLARANNLVVAPSKTVWGDFNPESLYFPNLSVQQETLRTEVRSPF